MTREEHIENLKKLKSFHNGSYGDSIRVAIKALEQEPSGDLISRSALMIALMDKGVDHIQADDLAEINQIVSELPSVNPQEPCEDAISREVARRIIDSGRSKEQMLEVLNNTPSVNPQPKTGHWIDGDRTRWKCSNCGYGVLDWNNTPYCPNCGAKMIEPQESEEEVVI